MSGAIPEKNEGWLVFLDMEDERPDAWFATEEDARNFLSNFTYPQWGDIFPAIAHFELGGKDNGNGSTSRSESSGT